LSSIDVGRAEVNGVARCWARVTTRLQRTKRAVGKHGDLFVCPSVYEPFGIINLEAMACETPVVASAVGGIPEILVSGETRERVQAQFSWRSIAEQAHRFYRELLDAPGTSVG
jgi:hypothetical protein